VFANPPDDAIRSCLAGAGTIAVVGLSPRTDRPSHRVARRLQRSGYRIVPVRPAVSTVLGEKAYPRLADVPQPIDLVDVFRAARDIGPIVEQCIALDIPAIWIQQGIVNTAAAERARAAGLFVVMDRCISVELGRLMPERRAGDG
jgi:predicted CoA-binding protein